MAQCRFPSRKTEEISYATLRFYARGGSHNNYYMYMGGNNYGRTAATSLTTAYADNVNFHSDSIPNEPKKTHLSNLHALIRRYADVIVEDEAQLEKGIRLPYWSSGQWKEGTEQTAFEYKGRGGFIAFMENDAV